MLIIVLTNVSLLLAGVERFHFLIPRILHYRRYFFLSFLCISSSTGLEYGLRFIAAQWMEPILAIDCLSIL